MIGLVVATLLGGCLPQSHEPIAPASEAIVEPRLAGLWVGQHDGQAIYIHVLQRDLGMMDVLTSATRPTAAATGTSTKPTSPPPGRSTSSTCSRAAPAAPARRTRPSPISSPPTSSPAPTACRCASSATRR